jgi:hypothetical protein
MHVVHANVRDDKAASFDKGWHNHYWKPWNNISAGKKLQGAESKPKLKSHHFFYSHIDLNLPPSGIVFDPDSIEKNVVIIIRSLSGRSKTFTPGYGIPTALDTLFCNHKRYIVDVYISGDLPANWNS